MKQTNKTILKPKNTVNPKDGRRKITDLIKVSFFICVHRLPHPNTEVESSALDVKEPKSYRNQSRGLPNGGFGRKK